ncbi:MvdC/MvdD family ATP grasp protein [Nonomuraea sp. NPDC050328]|uniref:MvdC/MvdD family ATP grasp protein n=1 Tax=Nonomuraea sp. NPDC050328 TaxID=3364361 RepID=UPI0037A9D7CA
MLLVLAARTDTTVGTVVPKIERQGVECLAFDPATYPASGTVTADFTGGRPRFTLRTGADEVDLGRVRAVWNRLATVPEAATAVAEPSHRAHAAGQARRLLDGIWETLAVPWLPGPPSAVRRAHNKIIHLARAVELGFTAPPTLVTNDPAAARRMYERSEGRMVAKLIDDPPFTLRGETHTVFTTVTTRRMLTARHAIRHEPVILQPYVAKHVELRVTVVGERVFAAEIDSQSHRTTRDDWRHYDTGRVLCRPHALPRELERRCVDLVAGLGLTFGAIDLILTPEGDYVFLEINPNGEWGGVEEASGLPIGDAVARWLTGGTR